MPLREQDSLWSEADLLGPEPTDDDDSTSTARQDHAVITAPILAGDALSIIGSDAFPQTALYGRVLEQHGADLPLRAGDSRLFVNTNAPFSALVCGVQGSGKSHTTSVLLESVLIPDHRLGNLPEPLSALVFHLDSAAGGGMVQPCEAAYLAAVDPSREGGSLQAPPVTVLVLPNNLRSMRAVYQGLPGVRVEPLHFAPQDISGERLLAMMKVDETAQMPLYMEAIMNILRSMETFDYRTFREHLQAQRFNPGQKAMLSLRLSLLDSCLNGGTRQNSVVSHFGRGCLTIIDLSSPFMDGSSACGFFDIILGLFVEADIQASGKIVVLDEAHKYLSDKGSSSRLTESLLTVIRQQRHLATRVVVSTQEPTVVPEKFVDLCSFVIAHRFSSPTWLKHLAEHISSTKSSIDELWEKVLSLGTGQAVLFCPNGLVAKKARATDMNGTEDHTIAAPLGQGYLVVKSRLRVTRDGGHSLLAVQDANHTTRLNRVPRTSGPDTVPTSVTRNETSAPSLSTMSFPFAFHAQLGSELSTTRPYAESLSREPPLVSFIEQSGSRLPIPPVGLATPVAGSSQPQSTANAISQSPMPPPSQLVHRSPTHRSMTHKYNLRPFKPPQVQPASQTKITSFLTTTVARDPFAPIRLFLLKEEARGYAQVPYHNILRDLVGQDAGKPFHDADSLTQAIGAAAARGEVISTDQNGTLWISLPPPPTTPAVPQDTNLMLPPALSQQTQRLRPPSGPSSYPSSSRLPHVETQDASDSDEDSVDIVLDDAFRPADYVPILRCIAKAHADGFASVGFSWLHQCLKRLPGFKPQSHLRAAVANASSARELVLLQDGKGLWLVLPPDSNYRIPSRNPTESRPREGFPGEMDRLVAFLGTGQHKMKAVRKHFRMKVPDTPYGQTPSAIAAALDRAHCLGFVVIDG